ncbi:hypothetical protein GCM10027589_21630 [Actinocorallia lasiicapitis]
MQDGPTALEESWDEPKRRTPKKGWGGGGGRWWIWVGRVLLWTFVLVVIVNGIRAPFERFTAPDGPGTTTSSIPADGQFPVSGASAFALQFTQVYLNYDQITAVDRQKALERFVPAGSDQFGWDGKGQLAAGSAQVASVDVKDVNRALVNVVAKVGTRWIQLSVPVFTRGGGFVVSGRPALLEPPARIEPPDVKGIDHDTDLEAQLQNTLQGFFQAYAASDKVNLPRFTDNPAIQGLGGGVTFGQLGDIDAPKGSSDERTVTVPVTWIFPQTLARGSEGMVTMVYELTVVKKSGNWNVASIRGAQAGS